MIKIKRFLKIILLVTLAFAPNAIAKVPSFIEKNLTKKSSKRLANITYYSKGTYNDYFEALGSRESSNNYYAVNQYGYLGKYQMGEAALIQAGYYKYDGSKVNNWTGEWTSKAQVSYAGSKNKFLNNKTAQENAVRIYTQKNWELIKHYKLHKYVGTTINNIKITESGLLAGAHLLGIGNLRKFILNNSIKKDANGVSITSYIKAFGGYNTPFNKPTYTTIAKSTSSTI